MGRLSVEDSKSTLTTTLAHLSISWADFDALASGTNTAAAVGPLRDAERNRRLLLLRALIDETTKHSELTSKLPSVEEAWELLATVEELQPAVLDLVLSHPYTGSWLTYTTRILRNEVDGVGPRWAHIGYIHALAATAAHRAHITFSTGIPAWHGEAILPTLGLAHFSSDEEWSIAQVNCASGRTEISHGTEWTILPEDSTMDTANWWGIRQIPLLSKGFDLTIHLDDVDPYRGPYEPIRAQRTDPAEELAWRELLPDAWQLITACLPDAAHALQSGFSTIAPHPPARFRTPSASSSEAFGSAILGRPHDAATLAAMIVHEFRHNELGTLLHLTELHKDDKRLQFYAAWRDDPRPLGGMVQGVYACAGMAEFWRALAKLRLDPVPERAEFEYAYHRTATRRGVEDLRHDSALTKDGRRFIDGISRTINSWQKDPVSSRAVERADAVATDHLIGWRIRHIRPDPALVNQLAEAWRAGRKPPLCARIPDPAPTPVPDGPWSSARADLVRLMFAEDESGRHEDHKPAAEATTADVAWATRHTVEALSGYRTEISKDPTRPASWAGLALALSAQGTSPAVRALCERPELVRAVYGLVHKAEPTDQLMPERLAAWIGMAVC